MKHNFLTIFLVLLASVSGGIAMATPVNGHAVKVFTSGTGVKVTVVYLEPSSDKQVLIKLEGYPDSALNEKVILAKREPGGTGENWMNAQDHKIVMSLRKNYGSESFEVYPDRKSSGEAVSFSTKETKNAKAEELVTAFNKNNP